MLNSNNFSSSDHIELIQSLTQGRILISQTKTPSISDLRFYESSYRVNPPLYFINCPFPEDILTRESRDAERYALRPGLRHDITLDFEKKKSVVGKDGKTRFVKDEIISDLEKTDLLRFLEKVKYVAWAGPTPHGVHAGVYLSNWIPKEHSKGVLLQVMADLKAAGYMGSVELDWGASVNFNRPSRYLGKFAFWRPKARLTLNVPAANSTKVNKETKSQPTTNKATTTPSLAPDPAEQLALRARTNLKTADETAREVGKTVAWVIDFWASNPQTTFNPWNRKVGVMDESEKWRPIGPRTERGKVHQKGPELYEHCAWSWEWCRDKGIGVEEALVYVLKSQEFTELLDEIKKAWEEDKRVNVNDPPNTRDWQEWTQVDIARCYAKYTGWVSPRKLDRVRNALVEFGKPFVMVADIIKQLGPKNKISRSTITLAFKKLELCQRGNGRTTRYEVPDKILSSSHIQTPTPPPIPKPMRPTPPTASPTPIESSTPPTASPTSPTSPASAVPLQFPCVTRLRENNALAEPGGMPINPDQKKPEEQIPEVQSKDAQIAPVAVPTRKPPPQFFHVDVEEYNIPDIPTSVADPELAVRLILMGPIETPKNLRLKRRKRQKIAEFPVDLIVYFVGIGKCFGGKRVFRGLVEVVQIKFSACGKLDRNDILTAKSGREFIKVRFDCNWPDENKPHVFFRGQPLRLEVKPRRRERRVKEKTGISFQTKEISSLPAFTSKIKKTEDPDSINLATMLSQKMQKALATYDANSPKAGLVQKSVVNDLNRIIRDPSMAASFDLKKVSQETRDLMTTKPQGKDLARAHRRLLEETFRDLRKREIFGDSFAEGWAFDLRKDGPEDVEVSDLIFIAHLD